MPVGVADVVEIVVLAAGAHALLRRGGARVGARLLAGEDVLELHHPGADVNIKVGSLRGTSGEDGTDRVAVPGEEIQEGRADLIDAAHDVALAHPDLQA